MGCEIADSGELVVVHELRVPLRQRLVRRCRVVHLCYSMFILMILIMKMAVIISDTL